MVQNHKVVHWPDEQPQTAEPNARLASNHPVIYSLLGPHVIFRCFYPYPVRFEPIRVRVVHTEASGKANCCLNGPMDTISGKNCATVADIVKSRAISLHMTQNTCFG